MCVKKIVKRIYLIKTRIKPYLETKLFFYDKTENERISYVK